MRRSQGGAGRCSTKLRGLGDGEDNCRGDCREVFQLSGRASRQRNRLDLTPPGGWLPTYSVL